MTTRRFSMGSIARSSSRSGSVAAAKDKAGLALKSNAQLRHRETFCNFDAPPPVGLKALLTEPALSPARLLLED